MKTFTPFEYLLIDVANQYGLDKKLYEQRIAWTQENLDKLETLVNEAESPNMYWKAVDAVRCAQAGIPTGHLVGFDSAASGIQLLSVCARCVVGMMNTGILNDSTRTSAPDIYTTATKVMNRESYVRKAVKNALMTLTIK
jgi:DNA-directed RNA polymerase